MIHYSHIFEITNYLFSESVLPFIPIIFLYAELHYRFKWIGSRYYKKEPEILSDIPLRIEPGEKLPIIIIIKDANLYPIILNNIKVIIFK